MMAPERRGYHWEPGRLWSLWDMQKLKLDSFWRVSAEFVDAMSGIYFTEADPQQGILGEPLSEESLERIENALNKLSDWCKSVGLTQSVLLIEAKLAKPPKSSGEMDMIWLSIEAEMKDKLFLFVPSNRATYYNKDNCLNDDAREKFPKANQELHDAGNCYASGLYTACAFHCMRALEYGIGAMANDVNVEYNIQNWQNILDEIGAAVAKEGKSLPRGQEKNDRLCFLSQAVAEFRFFKDGWRNHVSHNKISYDEAQSEKIFEHVVSFVETLSEHLSE